MTHDVDVDDGGVAALFGRRSFSVKEELMLADDLFPYDEESDLVYFPGDISNSIVFPDDVPGNPFARQQDTAFNVSKHRNDPRGKEDVPSAVAVVPLSNERKNLPAALNSKSSTTRPVVDKVTGKILYYKLNNESCTWSRPNFVDFHAATSGVVAAKANKKLPAPPRKLRVVEECKVNSSYDNEEADEQQIAGSIINGNPFIVIDNRAKGDGRHGGNDDVSATSSLSASNAGWYQHQSAVHEKQLRNAVPSKQCAAGVVFVQGSCSERINGIYAYTGLLDSVGIYTKVESYGSCKVSFRIHRRLDETMSRRWYLSIGPSTGRPQIDHDINLYSAPAQVSGPAACFVDELPPRNNWEPVAGSGLEGTRGPLCLWIPKNESSQGEKEIHGGGTQTIVVPEPKHAAGVVVGIADKETKNWERKESPPRQIIVQKKTKKKRSSAVSTKGVCSNIFRPSDTTKPCLVIVPSKSTDTDVTAATSTGTFDLNLERVSNTSEGTPATRQSFCPSTNTSRSSSLSDLGEKGRSGTDLVEYNIFELLDFPETDEGFPMMASIGEEDIGNSDHEWSDLSDGEDDGVEARGDTLVRQWTEQIYDAEKKKRHKVVKWNDDEGTEGNVSVRLENLEADDEDFQFYARTKAGKESIIVENIGSALFRRFKHSPRSCRCAECKKEALEAYSGEKHETPRGTLFEI